METSEIQINIKSLLIEWTDLTDNDKLFIKCKLIPQDYTSKLTCFQLYNSGSNKIDWNESVVYAVKYSNLNSYLFCLRILQEIEPNSFALCGSVQFLLKDVMNFHPGFVTNPISCHMRIHQNVSHPPNQLLDLFVHWLTTILNVVSGHATAVRISIPNGIGVQPFIYRGCSQFVRSTKS